MESGYWHSHQPNNWSVLSAERNLQTASRSSTDNGRFPETPLTNEIAVLQPILFSSEVQFLSDLKHVMKKTAMLVVGVTLFVAGYRHIHRQTEYISAQAAQTPTSQTTSSTAVPDNIKQTIAFRLVQPF